MSMMIVYDMDENRLVGELLSEKFFKGFHVGKGENW